MTSNLAGVAETLSWFREQLREQGEAPQKIGRLELALEEALVNVVFYAYPHAQGAVEVSLEKTPSRFTLQIRDWGLPFNPLEEAPSVDREASLEKREVGGLGIYLIRNIMDEVSYVREEGANIFTMSSFRKK